MRRRKAWQPEQLDLERLSEHVGYEVQMTFFLAEQLAAPTTGHVAPLTRNGQVEAFALHLRQLLVFFWGARERREGDFTAFADDYFSVDEWPRLRPPMARPLERALHERVGVARLSYDRDWIRPADKVWDTVTQAFALALVVKCFADHVDRSLFRNAHGLRVSAELFEQGRASKAAA